LGDDLEEDEIENAEQQQKKTLRELNLNDITLDIVDQTQELKLHLFITHG
jgi:hypothetical protein